MITTPNSAFGRTRSHVNAVSESGTDFGKYAPLRGPWGAHGRHATSQEHDSERIRGGSAARPFGIAEGRQGERPTILIVEDERIFSLDLTRRVKDLGYDVAGSAVSGREATAKAQTLRPDIVLMDIHLEGEMDGIDAAREIHSRWGIPIIFLTAYGSPETLDRAVDSLPFGYLLKPINATELQATLRMTLARRDYERDIREREERLRLALTAGALAVIEAPLSRVVDPEFADNCTRYCKLSGVLCGAPIGDPSVFWERLLPEGKLALLRGLRSAVQASESVAIDLRYRRDDGTNGVLEMHVSCFGDIPEQPSRLIGIMRDLTEQRRLEAHRRQTEVVFQYAAEGIFVLDAGFRLVFANPTFHAMTGYGDSLLGADPLQNLLIQWDRDNAAFREAAIHGRWQGEVTCQHRDGRCFPAWLNLCPVAGATEADFHFVGVLADISTVRRAEQDLDHLAHHDALTSLPNRLLFNDRLRQALERGHRDGRRFAVVYIDLDGFKVVNDTLGHGIGDALLRSASSRLTQLLRKTDTAARLGGDEFVLLMEDIGQAEDIAVPLRKLLASLSEPFEVPTGRISLTASAGVSLYPEDGQDAEALLRAADTAMYEAKSSGRNTFCFHTTRMAERVRERLDVDQGLRGALNTGELLLHYQPILNVSDLSVVGVEALLRWHHPDKGLILPERFIGVAEDTGFIRHLGAWVINQACAEAAAKAARVSRPFRLSINVSARQLLRDQLPAVVKSALLGSGFPGDRLDLEITESTLQSLDDSIVALKQLKDLGVQITVDDFGTGYSSLGRLQHLPIDRIKIDRSFMQNLSPGSRGEAMIKAVIGMGTALELGVTAEGIETWEQMAILKMLGCHEAQGYLFCAPKPWGEREFGSFGLPA